jgi:type I restriction enzyme S subunit
MTKDIPAGYKLTEVGVIPGDWSESTIGELIEFQGGSQPEKSVFSNTPRPGFVRLIQIRDYKSDRFEVFAPTALLRRFCDEYDIMIGRYGPPVFQILRGLPGAYNVALIKAIPRSAIDREFAYYFLKQDSLFEFIDKLSRRSSGQTGVDLAELRQYPLPLPPLPEQRAIATALSDVDALLAKLDALIAKKRELKTATLQQLLTGQTRLPGFSGDWQLKEIGSQIDLLTGFPFQSSQYVGSGVRLLRGSNVKRGETDWHDDLVQFWPVVTQDVKRYELEADDLVIAMDGSLVGRSYARLTSKDLPALLLQRVARIRSKAIDVGFLAQVVGSEQFVQYCDSVKTVTAIPHISAANIRNFEVYLPPSIEEQTAIAAILSDMDTELAALQTRRDKTHALKQGMMQELLTGRIRLK